MSAVWPKKEWPKEKWPKKRRELLKDFIALVAGALFPLSLSPFDLWPFALISGAALFSLVQTCSLRRCIQRFYLYNLGMFGVGISWIYVSIHEYGGASMLLAGFLVVLFVFAYALICVPQSYLFGRYLRNTELASAIGFCALWVLQEWVRSWFLTGFPWLFLGYGVMGTPLEHFAPVTGIFGVSLAAIICSVALWLAISRRSALMMASPALVVTLGFGLGQFEHTESNGHVSVSLIQGNINQHAKWRPENRMPIFRHYLQATSDEWGRDLIVWPEASVTMLRENAEAYLVELAQKGVRSGTTLVLGIPDTDEAGGLRNTVIALGNGEGQYVKRRLVPFGEYVPLENFLRGFIRFFDLPMSRNTPGTRHQLPLLAGNLRLSTSICYEVVYPNLVRSTLASPDLLLTVSNDTWFGRSIGPWQHLQMARMRALENGRSLVRATNNGVTAIINHRGRLISKLPQFEVGVLRGDVEIRTGTTPFHQLGSTPILVLCLLMSGLAAIWAVSNRRE